MEAILEGFYIESRVKVRRGGIGVEEGSKERQQ